MDLEDNNLEFEPNGHKYFYNFETGKKELTSATTVLKEYFPFDADGVSESLSESNHPVYGGKSKEEILEMWKQKSQFGTDVHDLVENYLNGEFVSITNKREIVAYNYVKNLKFDRIWNELKIAAPEWGICGTIDCLVQDKGKFYIYDWKTDKTVRKKSYDGEKCPGILGHIENCNFNKFTYQLSLYKLILDVFYDIQVENCYIVHFTDFKATEYVLQYPVEYLGLLIQKHMDESQ